MSISSWGALTKHHAPESPWSVDMTSTVSRCARPTFFNKVAICHKCWCVTCRSHALSISAGDTFLDAGWPCAECQCAVDFVCVAGLGVGQQDVLQIVKSIFGRFYARCRCGAPISSRRFYSPCTWGAKLHGRDNVRTRYQRTVYFESQFVAVPSIRFFASFAARSSVAPATLILCLDLFPGDTTPSMPADNKREVGVYTAFCAG